MTPEKIRAMIAEARRLENDYGDNYEVMLHMSDLADALEVSTRQPSEDGEYILKLIESIRESRSSVEIAGVKIMPCDEYGRTAAVPGPLRIKFDGGRGAMVDENDTIVGYFPEGLRAAAPDAATELRAERDAALAAIERIRQAVAGHPECDRCEEGDVISCGWKSAYASVVAALDGAPEPAGLPVEGEKP